MLHRTKTRNNKIACKYRLVKAHRKDGIILYWIQYPVKLFGWVLWWETTSDIPYTDEYSAHKDMDALCSEAYYEMKDIWKKENNHHV